MIMPLIRRAVVPMIALQISWMETVERYSSLLSSADKRKMTTGGPLMPKKPDGLVAAYEMMVVTPAIQNLIRENKTYRIDSSIQTGRKHGMFLLDESLFRLWKDELVEKEEALMRAAKPADLAAKIAQAERGDYEEGDEEYDEDDDDYDDDDDDDEDDDEPRRRPTGIRRR